MFVAATAARTIGCTRADVDTGQDIQRSGGQETRCASGDARCPADCLACHTRALSAPSALAGYVGIKADTQCETTTKYQINKGHPNAKKQKPTKGGKLVIKES